VGVRDAHAAVSSAVPSASVESFGAKSVYGRQAVKTEDRRALGDTHRCASCLRDMPKSYFPNAQLYGQKGPSSRLTCKACISSAHVQAAERARVDSRTQARGDGLPAGYGGIDDIYRTISSVGTSSDGTSSVRTRANVSTRWRSKGQANGVGCDVVMCDCHGEHEHWGAGDPFLLCFVRFSGFGYCA
jgi:hypothetical protein